MNLKKKKELAKKTLGAGGKRIIFLKSRLDEIKEAITKKDIRDLQKDGAIMIKEIKGRRRKEKISKKIGAGSIKRKIRKRKRGYVRLTRKLRAYLSEVKKRFRLSRKEIDEIRKGIKNRTFRSKSHLKEHIIKIKK